MGECLVGLARPVQALELWRKFLKDMPAGPWRGQARVASADLLMEQLDLPGSTDHIRQAAAILDNLATLPSPVVGRGAGGEGAAPADHSWQEAAPDIRVRQGILALLAQQDEAAATALKLAKVVGKPPAGVDRLIHFAEKKTTLIPNELGSTDRGVALALALGRIAALMGRNDQAAMLFTSVQSGRIRAQPLPKRPTRPSGWPAR